MKKKKILEITVFMYIPQLMSSCYLCMFAQKLFSQCFVYDVYDPYMLFYWHFTLFQPNEMKSGPHKFNFFCLMFG